MNKDIINRNYNGEYHGYQEWYINNKIYYRGIRKNNNRIGYTEYHLPKRTRFNII